MPPMQKRALYELIANIVLVVIGFPAFVFATRGSFSAGDVIILLMLLILASTLAHWLPRYLTRPRPNQPVIADERDWAVLRHVPRYQFAGTLATVAACIIVLVTVYRNRGEVPIEILWLIWFPVWVANSFFTTLGVLIEYRWAQSSTRAEEDPDYWFGGGIGRWRYTIAMVPIVVAGLVGIVLSASDSNQGARADFTSDVAVVYVGDPVRFTDTTERRDSSILGEAAAQRWEFGDCTYSDERDPLHAYANPGEYTVELTVFYRDGARVMADHEITVLPAEAPAPGGSAGSP